MLVERGNYVDSDYEEEEFQTINPNDADEYGEYVGYDPEMENSHSDTEDPGGGDIPNNSENESWSEDCGDDGDSEKEEDGWNEDCEDADDSP